jgi:lipopolysaccharide/colanic/teichoic acid biosynthesis glycosyltransferase
MSGCFGDVLRRTEIAEVPLLFNILAGEVSIDWVAVVKGSVRPMPREGVEKIDAEAQDLIRRLSLQTNAARRNRHRELGPMPDETISTEGMAR